MEKKKYWLKGITIMLALVMALSSFAAPMPAQAAAKKITVEVKSPKKGVKLSGSKLNAHVKKAVQLTVKYGSKDVSAKASYKSSNPAVVSVGKGGKLAVKKDGKAVVTVSYKGTSKKLNVTVGKHSWKAHKAVKTINHLRLRCGCGKLLPEIEEKDCPICRRTYVWGYMGLCQCKLMAHVDNCDSTLPATRVRTKKKVKYIDYYQCSCGMKKKGEPEPKDEY